jgi:hypothetical protein
MACRRRQDGLLSYQRIIEVTGPEVKISAWESVQSNIWAIVTASSKDNLFLKTVPGGMKIGRLMSLFNEFCRVLKKFIMTDLQQF